MSITPDMLYHTAGIRIKKGACVVIVKTEWNAQVTDKLLAGCIEIFTDYKVKYRVVEVPGAFEIPFTIRHLWRTTSKNKPTAFIALGCVIKGDTPHFDFVAKAVTDGILKLNLELPVPVIYGVLTVNSQQQADERTGGTHGHKGREAAITAMKMISMIQKRKTHQ